MSVVSGYALQQMEDEEKTYGFLALFPSTSSSKLKLIYSTYSNQQYTNEHSRDVVVVTRKGESGGIGDIAAPPSTEVWLLHVSTVWRYSFNTAFSVVGFDSKGEVICQNGFTLEKLKEGPSTGGFQSGGEAIVHDGRNAYLIASINNLDSYYAENPVIIARFDGKCGLSQPSMFRIGSSPDSRAYVGDAVYSGGYIYAAGVYKSGVQGAPYKMLALKISAETLGIVDSRILIIPGTEDMSLHNARVDAGNGVVAISGFYTGMDNMGKLATITLNPATMQPVWASTVEFQGEAGSGVAEGVMIKDGMVLTAGSIFQGNYTSPDASKGFITAHLTDTGALGAAYTLGFEGAIMFKDMAARGDDIMVAAEWIPGALDAGLQNTTATSNTFDGEDITVIDIPRSKTTSPLKPASDLTGGLNIVDATDALRTGYSNMKDHSLYITTLKASLQEESTTIGTTTESQNETSATTSQQTASQTTVVVTEGQESPTETGVDNSEDEGDGIRQYIQGIPLEILAAIAILLLAIAVIAIKR
ncbi:trehalose and maltose hydrolase [Aeropyrum camini SY1 = JCM 12091]|uniref:Trehalose and maltose hydrolase n=1 Tax=Aeropyrum camini SY1 = JCM 12091 TaxID=1198449 RepID=U3TG19_9CREN|nr:trehalose and maltose hydrolase [Aeropyrum camini SY1 = JCM 12091]